MHIIYSLLYMCIHLLICAWVYLWRSGDSLWALVLLFYHVGIRIDLRSLGCATGPLDHLTDPVCTFEC